MEGEIDCDKPAPFAFRTALHITHIFSFPIYSLVLTSLIRIESKTFATYKYYLVFHTLVNLLFEIYTSFLWIPRLYLPVPILRSTGILSSFGVNGLIQFNIMTFFIGATGFSIMEMFMFRYKAAVMDYSRLKYTIYMRVNIYLYRFVFVGNAVVGFTPPLYDPDGQHRAILKLYNANPGLPIDATCYSSVMANFENIIQHINIVSWFILMGVCITVPNSAMCYIYQSWNDGINYSPQTIKIQKMLLTSLIIQTSIHYIMIAVPAGLFIYIVAIGFSFSSFTYVAFGMLNSHGIWSTIAMIIFTKPIRDGIIKLFFCLKRKPVVNIAPVISVQSTGLEPNS